MSEISTIEDLLIHCVKDLYSAETQLVEALPRMAAASSDSSLAEAFETHLAQTQAHVTRLEQVADLLGDSPHGMVCKGMEGLIAEGEEILQNDGGPIKDLALIGAARKVEYYEISGYCSAKELAESLGNLKVVALLQTTEEEEKGSDNILSGLTMKIVGAAPSSADSVA